MNISFISMVRTGGPDNHFRTMAARAAIRDVGRALDIPYGEVDKIAKMVPTELGVTLDRALSIAPDLMELYSQDYTARQIIDTARALEGMPRHASVHAAGVVIGKESLSYLLPLQRTGDGHIITQFTKETVEDIGLLKMDILGLRTLTVINRAVEIIEKIRGEIIDIDNIDLGDEKVYELLSQGDTIGVFQLESQGLRRILKEMLPGRFEDLIAIIALYRPDLWAVVWWKILSTVAWAPGNRIYSSYAAGYIAGNLWGSAVPGAGNADSQYLCQLHHG